MTAVLVHGVPETAGVWDRLKDHLVGDIVARLAQRLDLSPVSANVPAPAGMVVNRPTGGAPMLVNPRREADTTARP